MGRISTFPTLYEDMYRIDLSTLKMNGFLCANQIKSGTLKWLRGDIVTGTISILVNSYLENPFIQLSYNYNGNSINYKIALKSISSNLGIGVIWYFICPKTNNCCRVLYCFEGYFLHREACENCMYESQTYSKSTRKYISVFKRFLKP